MGVISLLVGFIGVFGIRGKNYPRYIHEIFLEIYKIPNCHRRLSIKLCVKLSNGLSDKLESNDVVTLQNTMDVVLF